MNEERRTRPNAPLADAVDATMGLMPHISRYQAALVMARDGVPKRVIRRVLDEPGQRRATGRPKPDNTDRDLPDQQAGNGAG